MAQQFILQENPLTDNTLMLPDEGNVFKGQYIAIIQEYVYLNPWNDRCIVKRFRSQSRLDSYLEKKYPNFQY